MGTFFKQIYRYTRPRSYRHNENLWPYVKITRAAEGHIQSFKLRGHNIPLVDLSELKGKFSGDLLLVASGPSVNDTDFSPLVTMPAMGVNGAWFLHNVLDFSLYVIVDMTFIDQRLSLVKEIVSRPEVLLFTTINGIMKIVHHFGIDALRCRLAVVEDACFRVYQPKIQSSEIYQTCHDKSHISFSPKNNNIAFSNDIREGIFDAATVVYWSLQIVKFMGFSRVIIAGLDMNNFHRPRFYENDKDRSPSFLESQFSVLIEPAFSLASSIFKEDKIQVLNLSQNSALSDEIFKKVTSHDI